MGDAPKGSRGQCGGRKPGGGKKTTKDPFGIDALTEVEQRQIAQGAVVTEEQLQRVYGLHHPVRHPCKPTSDATKGVSPRWNPHCFMKLKRAAMKMLQGALTRSFERQQHDRTPLEPKHKQNQNDHKTHMWLSQLKYRIQRQEVELRKTPKTSFLSIF